MTITAAMMTAKGASDFQVARFNAECPGGLNTSNLPQVKSAMSSGVDLKWIAKRFSAAGAAYDAAVAAANEAYREALFNSVMTVPPGLLAVHALAVKAVDLMPSPPSPANVAGAAKILADKAIADGVAAVADVPASIKAAAFSALFVGE